MRGLNIVDAPMPVVSRSCVLRVRAARATASFSRDRVRCQYARPLSLDPPVGSSWAWCSRVGVVSGLVVRGLVCLGVLGRGLGVWFGLVALGLCGGVR